MNDISNKTIYVVALCHLYGMIKETVATSFYNKHHANQIESLSLDVDMDELESNFIYYDKGFFIQSYIYEDYNMSDHIKRTNGIPYYLPDLETILKYEDDFYREPNPFIDKLHQQIFHIVSNKNTVYTENLVDAVMGLKQIGSNLDDIKSYFKEQGITDGKIEKILPNVINLMKHTRSHLNRGYTDFELEKLEQDRLSLKDTDLCLCGSLKPYDICCKHEIKIGLGNPDLFEDDPFLITDEMIQDYRSRLNVHRDKILGHILSLTNPSLTKRLDDLTDDELRKIFHLEDKLVLAGIVEMVFVENGLRFTSTRREKIYRALGICGKRDQMEDIMYILDDLLIPRTGLTDNALFEHVIIYLDNHDLGFKTMPSKKPFDFLYEGIKQTKPNKKQDAEIETLSYQVYQSNLPDKLKLFYNLLRLYPLSVSTLRFAQDFIDFKEEKTILELIVMAFEKVNEKLLNNPPKDFYRLDDNRIYIQSLDTLALHYKRVQNYKGAIKLYEKIIKYDDTDRFVAKESILICYMSLNRIDEYEQTLESLPDDSIYKLFIKLYEALIYEEPFIERYLEALNHYPNTMDALCYGYKVNDQKLAIYELLFLSDFYLQMTYKTHIIKPLLDLHKSRFNQALKSGD